MRLFAWPFQTGPGPSDELGGGGRCHRGSFGDEEILPRTAATNRQEVKAQERGAHQRLSVLLRPVKRGRPPRLDTTTPIPIRRENERRRGAIFHCLPSFNSFHSFLGWTGARARAGLAAGSNRLTLLSGRAWEEWEAGGSCIWWVYA